MKMLQSMLLLRPSSALTILPTTQTFRGYYIHSNVVAIGSTTAGPVGTSGWNSVSKRISVSSSLVHGTKSSSTSHGEASWFKRLLFWYSHKLDTYPLMTNSMTCAFIATSGDFLCQYVSFYRRKGAAAAAAAATSEDTRFTHPNQQHDQQHRQDTTSFFDSKYSQPQQLRDGTTVSNRDTITDQDASFQADSIRLARFGSMGFFLVAPSVYLWFKALHVYVPGTSTWAVTKRVLYDQLLYSPIFEPTLVLSLMAMEGRSTQHMMDFLTNGKASALVVANWVLWFPAQFINFALVPFKYQVLFSNLVSVIWNGYLSWTTFEQDDDDVQEQFVHPT